MVSQPIKEENITPNQKPIDLKKLFIQYRVIIVTFFISVLIALFLPGRMKLYVFSGILSGTLVGLAPYWVAKFYKQYRTATWAMVSCIVCGGTSGLFLVLPVALIFLVVISLRANRSTGNPPVSRV